ncbi:MAG TPA: hypothetical protein VK917_07120 [Ilumatobacter sp.]|nr:hypothetical protein [Ilumatobacter sp.]
MGGRIVLMAIGATLAGSAMVADGAGHPTAHAAVAAPTSQGTVCVGDQLADLNRLFDTEPAGIVGADYQRATELPDGRVFWTFQDGAIRTGPGRIDIVHNIGAIQSGPCFTFLYGGTRAAPRPYLFAGATEPFRRWFWPLGTEIGADGRLHVFTAQMVERGATYLSVTEPVATHVAIVDPSTFAVVWEGSPANASADLYGWSVTSDHAWTYLYAHCFRQFGYDDFLGVPSHDLDCSTRITVGRVPVGDLLATPQYWDGVRWQPDPARAASIITTAGRHVNADQFLWTGGRFVSINKAGDWWGDTVFVSTSTSPTGPFVVTAQVPAVPKCAECNTFFASWVPFAAGARPPRTLAYALSHNRWDGEISAFYRPSVATVAAPIFLPAGGVFRVPVPSGGVPTLNVTAVRPAADGFVTVYPCDRSRPTASNLNFRAGTTTAAAVLVRPDARGEVCIYSSTATDLVVDTSGSLGASFGPADVPHRLLDTRVTAPLAADHVIAVDVPDEPAVVVNVAAVRPAAAGFLTVFPCLEKMPTASNLNFRAGENTANLAVVATGASGRVCIYTSSETDLIVDLAGTLGDAFVPQITSSRLADTRAARPIAPGEAFEVAVGDATAVVVNVAAVRPASDGFVTVFPCGEPQPTASNLNHRVGTNTANLVFVRPGVGGRVCITPSTSTHLVVDLAGAFGGDFVARTSPVRLADTRLLP